MTGLAHRIWSQCGEELDLFLDQVHALSRQEIGTGGLDCAATAMGRRRSITSADVSVDVVGFVAHSSGNGSSALGVSVALRFHREGSISQHHWEEAHAWAGAVAGGSWMAAKLVESVETSEGVVFHYSLIEDHIPVYTWTPPESR
ncbi:hypothetical protein ACW0JT_01930 [Arthrobacter sp. SA17]